MPFVMSLINVALQFVGLGYCFPNHRLYRRWAHISVASSDYLSHGFQLFREDVKRRDDCPAQFNFRSSGSPGFYSARLCTANDHDVSAIPYIHVF